ncbi:MAG TPA: hypothetical protein VD998_04170, partial [Verrucomicrobiae bacterium]|nr:hypothetical protein [Verrucomicrobiae bacterium]
NALGTAAYITTVAIIMQNAERIFGDMDNTTLGPITFLMLFVLSAAVTGSLVLGRPVLMYLDGQKKEAVKLFLVTIVWLALAIVILLAIIASR